MNADALLTQLVTDPTPGLLRVYADLLQEQGDVHGELIALQCAREEHGGAPSLREQALTEAVVLGLSRGLAGAPVEATWRLGFIDSVRLDLRPDQLALGVLATRPETRLLRELYLSLDGHPERELSEWWASFPTLPRLERLDFAPREPYLQLPPYIGVVAPLSRALPSLRSLSLRGTAHQLEGVVLPQLTHFAASRLSASAIPALVNAQWPQLESLELEFGPAQPEEVEPLFGPLLDAPMSAVLKRVQVKSPWPEFFSAALPRSTLGRGRDVSV